MPLAKASNLYSVALHAGTMENWTADPEVQAKTEALLDTIAQQAGEKLSNGAKAVDVVQYVVKCLEDYEGFNAGKGSAVNEAGGHEVSLRYPFCFVQILLG